MQLALAALTILALHGIEPPPNNRHTANQWAARLRADLTSQADWDPLVGPPVCAWTTVCALHVRDSPRTLLNK